MMILLYAGFDFRQEKCISSNLSKRLKPYIKYGKMIKISDIGEVEGIFVKKYSKEIFILLVQLIFFYIFPLFAIDPMGMVLIILLVTTILSVILGGVSNKKIKYIYPVAAALLFIPSVFVYYNVSALVHSLWYFTVSLIGLFVGVIVRKVCKRKD